MNGTLFIVSTPIGNLKDITLRALEILNQVDLIACEDTRRTQVLLNCYQIKKTLISYFEHNEEIRIPQILQKLKEGKRVALVCDAGTPLLSDPGFKLVRECIKNGFKVEAVPGPSAVLAALVSSSLPTDKFFFFGYLPPKGSKRAKGLKNLKQFKEFYGSTVVIFESPHRFLKTLGDLKNILGDREIVVSKELTKIHEEILRTKISQATKHFEEKGIKGELTILF